MNNFLKIFILAVLVIVFSTGKSFSQDDWWKEKKFKDAKTKIKFDDCKRTFKEISGGFNYYNISSINKYFGEQVFLNIIGSEKGYYSRAQAEIILDDFMSYFTIMSFKYKRSYYKNSFAFAVGMYKYDIGSGTRDLEVSISLRWEEGSWVIDQIIIN
jgi:hypothetical protein